MSRTSARAATSRSAKRPTRQPISQSAHQPARPRMRWGVLSLIVVASFAHAAIVAMTAFTTGSNLLTALALTVPAVLTAIALPRARRHGWHRWLTLWVVTFLVIPMTASLVLVTGQSWVLYRAWVLDFPRRADHTEA